MWKLKGDTAAEKAAHASTLKTAFLGMQPHLPGLLEVFADANVTEAVNGAAFAAFIRVFLSSFEPLRGEWVPVISAIAGLTMILGTVVGVAQTSVKRMLAYSSIAHAGYLLMALVAASTGNASNNPALASLLFYLLAYTFMNAGAFIVLAAFTRDGQDYTDIDSLAGLGKRHPWLAAGLSLCLLSMAGIPPTMGFVGKFYLFSAAIQSGQVPLAMIGALSAAAGVYYYLRPMVWMYMKEGHTEARVAPVAFTALAICGFALLAFGLVPGPMLGLAQTSLQSLIPYTTPTH
jgi:NADH-quinone oxidoreductase subunit N